MQSSLLADAWVFVLNYTVVEDASTSRISFLLQSRSWPVPTSFWTKFFGQGRRKTSAFPFAPRWYIGV
jgi:hypothetical protein